MRVHKSVTLDRVMAAVEDAAINCENPGFCIYCGADANGVEPDARLYTCEVCGEHGVYGAEELLLELA